MMRGQIAKAFPRLGKLYALKRMTAGAVNVVYEATCETFGDVIIKIYDERFKARVIAHARLLKNLSLPVPHFFYFSGNPFVTFHHRVGVVYPKLPGVSPRRPTANQRRQVGEFLARFHGHLAVRRFIGSRNGFYDLSDTRLRRIRALCKQKQLSHQHLLDELLKDIPKWRLSNRLPYGAIHVDLKPGNVLFSGGRLTGVLDFDNMYRGPLILDLAKSMVWFGLARRGYHPSAARDVLRGYETVRRLTSAERIALPRALLFAFASHVIVDFEMYAKGLTVPSYFHYIVGDFFASYKAFRHLLDREASMNVKRHNHLF